MKEKERKRFSVIGGGSWATALVKILSHNGHEVTWWVRQPETALHITNYHHNPKYLSSVEFSDNPPIVTTDINQAFSASGHIILATPSAYLQLSLQGLSPALFLGKVIISAIKGLVQPEDISVSEYLDLQYGIAPESVVNISGPCHAEEVAAEKLSFLTFACPDISVANELAPYFKCRFLNTYSSTDLKGAEYASVIKNIYALAAGISIGLGYGDNFRAVLICSAMREMQFFLSTCFPCNRNELESSYLGDTVVTSYSPYSRNRTFGVMIGKGYTINAAILELNMVAEGYYATRSIKHKADRDGISLPIVDSMHRILYERFAPAVEFKLLSSIL